VHCGWFRPLRGDGTNSGFNDTDMPPKPQARRNVSTTKQNKKTKKEAEKTKK
jgi:hypothetical protein